MEHCRLLDTALCARIMLQPCVSLASDSENDHAPPLPAAAPSLDRESCGENDSRAVLLPATSLDTDSSGDDTLVRSGTRAYDKWSNLAHNAHADNEGTYGELRESGIKNIIPAFLSGLRGATCTQLQSVGICTHTHAPTHKYTTTPTPTPPTPTPTPAPTPTPTPTPTSTPTPTPTPHPHPHSHSHSQ
jgi:cell division septation protein DedD